jgi:hypothetical protein
VVYLADLSLCAPMMSAIDVFRISLHDAETVESGQVAAK